MNETSLTDVSGYVFKIIAARIYMSLNTNMDKRDVNVQKYMIKIGPDIRKEFARSGEMK
jgi:hypothetical protein